MKTKQQIDDYNLAILTKTPLSAFVKKWIDEWAVSHGKNINIKFYNDKIVCLPTEEPAKK
jgi:hypothetical protein